MTTLRQQALELLADLLDYPRGDLAGRAEAAERIAQSAEPAAVPYFRSFKEFAERTPHGRLEEIYSALFDLNPVFYPYAGYQLFGETYRRSLFLLTLKERYRERGFELAAPELPDRLAVLLRFAAEHDEEADVIVCEALIPALRRVLRNPEEVAGESPEAAPADAHQSHQLEGHSHGEILKGGFLLALTEGGSVVSASSGRAAYECLLYAALLLLDALWNARGAGVAQGETTPAEEERG